MYRRFLCFNFLRLSVFFRKEVFRAPPFEDTGKVLRAFSVLIYKRTFHFRCVFTQNPVEPNNEKSPLHMVVAVILLICQGLSWPLLAGSAAVERAGTGVRR